MRIQVSFVDDDASVAGTVLGPVPIPPAVDPAVVLAGILRLIAGDARGHAYLHRIAVRSGKRILLVKACNVDWIGAEGNYVLVHVGKVAYSLRETIGTLEAQLDPALFCRIHRSAIVNVDRIRELRPQPHGDYRVVLESGVELSLSRGYREALNRLLDKPV